MPVDKDDVHDKYEQHHDMTEEEIIKEMGKELEKEKTHQALLEDRNRRLARIRAAQANVDLDEVMAQLRNTADIFPQKGVVTKQDMLMCELLFAIHKEMKEINKKMDRLPRRLSGNTGPG